MDIQSPATLIGKPVHELINADIYQSVIAGLLRADRKAAVEHL